MERSPASRVLRPLIIPLATILGFFAGPALTMPSADELRRRGEIIDGTASASAGILCLFLGALVGYIVRTALDHSIWWSSEHVDEDDREA